MNRIIPSTMATQHPDNAGSPYWDPEGRPFVDTQKELLDCISGYQDLNIPEYMWDWEGKYADASVVDKLFSSYHDYFEKNQLGKDKFLTFRLPNIWKEKGYSLLQAMSVILSAEDFARDLGFKNRPLFEVILPMTERADQIMHMHYLFEKSAMFKSEVFNGKLEANTEFLEIIPLVESVEGQQDIFKLLEKYRNLYHARYNENPMYLRPFLARSDPALVSGMLATVLANKIGLSQAFEFSTKHKIDVYPIAGVGSLPFRGGLMPKLAAQYVKENPGVRTVTIQSSFRFDHSQKVVKDALAVLDKSLPKTAARIIDGKTQVRLRKIIQIAQESYQATLSGVLNDMHPIFEAVPNRRERRQHIGLLAYKRAMGKYHLPRAIVFTAGFYSLGVPPEFIGIGSALSALDEKDRQLVSSVYSSLKSDLVRAGHYFNQDNLEVLGRRNRAWLAITKDIKTVEEILDVQLGPVTITEKSHANLSANVLLMKNNPRALPLLITETALLRRSLG